MNKQSVASKSTAKRSPIRRTNLAGIRSQVPVINHLLGQYNHLPALYVVQSSSLQRALLEGMQLRAGNAAIQRALANRSATTVQRQKAPSEKGGGEAEAAPKGKGSFNLDQWLSGQVYDAVKSQLGEAKLKSYAKDLAKEAGSLFLEQINGADSEANFLEKAQNKAFSDIFAQEVEKVVNEILKTKAGRKVKEKLLEYGRQNPGAVIGMVLTALAYMAATNKDIPKLELKKSLGKGFQVEAGANLGKFQDIALEKVKLGISYSKDKLELGLSGEYGQKPAKMSLSMREEALAAPQEIKLKTDPKLTSSGEVDFNFKLNSLGFKTSALFAGANKWMGKTEFTFGSKNNFFSQSVSYGSGQMVSIGFGGQFVYKALTFASAASLGPKAPTMGHYLQLDKPFGAEGLKIEAALNYQLYNPKLNIFKLSGQYKLPQSALVPVMIIKVEGKYQAGTPEKQPEFSGMIILVGYM